MFFADSVATGVKAAHAQSHDSLECALACIETALLSSAYDEKQRIAGRCTRVVLGVESAEDVLRDYLDMVPDEEDIPGLANLSHGAWAMTGAVVYAACFSGASESLRTKLEASQHNLGTALLKVSRGNPHNVTNNWWGITHAGLLVSALSSRAYADSDERYQLAKGRLLAFMSHFGPSGIYHEGLGYQAYTLSHVMPALHAMALHERMCVLDYCPQLSQVALGFFMPSSARMAMGDGHGGGERYGAYLGWNDAGYCWPSSGVAGLSLMVSDHGQALWPWFDVMSGARCPSPSFGHDWWGLYFNVMAYPYQTVQRDGDISTLPTSVFDSRQGLAMWRDRWHDGNDIVFGAYARATHVGGHSHDDAGSIRLMGLGHDWILGGGQNRSDAAFQSVALPNDYACSGAVKCGAVTWYDDTPTQRCMGMDLRKPRGAYCERYVAELPLQDVGIPGAFALLDTIDDHVKGRDWLWHLTVAPHLRIDHDAAGITLRAPDGACLAIRFVAAKPRDISVGKLPDTTRTYASGEEHRYPGLPLITARFAYEPHLAIYAVLVFYRGEDQVIVERDAGLGLHLNGNAIERPFGVAIGADFLPGQSPGPCQSPLG